MAISAIPEEEEKIWGIGPKHFETREEYEAYLANKKGFKSYKKYVKYLYEKRKIEEDIGRIEEKKIITEKETLRKLEEERKKLEEKEKLEELFTERERPKEELLKVKSKKELCISLQEIVSQVKDTESIFTDIEFVREYTGCSIPIKKKESKH